ncbi:hypothetical protein ACZ75_04850 [Massilia sp. NR 4-1]|nr:hypothetical protein ACZ75_04850 [Massilia sp. NR 4-1]
MDEVRQSWRALLRKPAYLVLACLTLALGVAACAGVFALVRASLLAPIAVPQIERVVVLGPFDGQQSAGGMAPIQFAHLNGLAGVEELGIAAPARSTVSIQNGERALAATSWQMSDGFLRALGMPMALGRGFNAEESRPDGAAAAIISHGYWQQYFGGQPDALGRLVRIDGRSVPITGVLPADFPFRDVDLLLPLAFDPNKLNWAGSYQVLARLQPGVAHAAAAAAVTARMRPLDAEYKMERFGKHAVYAAQPLEQALRARTGAQDVLLLFAASAAVLLLIVLVNLSNLALLRILSRSHDAAVRSALGAPPLRLLLPAIADQLPVALLGSALGLGLAAFALRTAASVIPPQWFISAVARPELDAASVALALLLAVAVVAMALLIGAWRARLIDLRETLAGGGRAGIGRKSSRLGGALVILQAGLATLLLLLAALCARTLWNSSQVEYGFDGEQVLVFHIKPDRRTYPDQRAVMTMADSLVLRLQAMPGAVRAAYGTNIPASGTDHNDTAPYITASGAVLDAITSYLISPGYLEVLGIDMEQGRLFDATHGANADSIIVSAELRQAAPASAALGGKLSLPYKAVNPAWADFPLQIRGVSKGVRAYGPNRDMPPIVWIPFQANTAILYELWRDADNLYFLIKVKGDPLSYAGAVEQAVHDIAPTLSVARLQPVSEYQSANLAQQRLNLALILVFAAAALLLSSVGLYSVMAVNVANRRHELGIRAALGAQPMRLLREVLVSGARQLACGLVLGLAAAFAASRLIQRFLFGVNTADPAAILLILLVLLAAGLLACLGPALRAARVSPMQALRNE